jgi:type IV pilus assembly protein PilZ
MGAQGTGSSQGILSLNIKDKSSLYAAYMPYVQNGGLFIPTNKQYTLGDEVFMLLSLMNDKDRLPVAGKIIWVTPQGAQNSKTAGIGVQFSAQDNGTTRNKIEGFLAGALQADRPTHTM